MYQIRNAQTQGVYYSVDTLIEALLYCRRTLGAKMQVNGPNEWIDAESLVFILKVA